MNTILSRRRIVLGLGLLTAMAGLANLAAGSAAASRDVAVQISGFAFGPTPLTVAAGTRVTWTNGDDIPHTVTSAATPHQFGSPPLDTGERFARVFDRPGTYRYFCAIHPHMQGVVVVR